MACQVLVKLRGCVLTADSAGGRVQVPDHCETTAIPLATTVHVFKGYDSGRCWCRQLLN